VGEARKFEVTDNNSYDIYAQLNSVRSGKANLTIKSIYEKIPAGERVEPAEKRSNLWILIILILVVIAALIIFKYKKRK